MNEQLQTALVDLINESMSGIDKTQDFLMAELPDVIQQLLAWHGVYNFTLFVFGVLLLFIVVGFNIFVGKKLFKNWEEFNRKADCCGAPVLFLSIVIESLAIVPLLFVCLNLQWLQIWIAPKVWLVEYAAKIIK